MSMSYTALVQIFTPQRNPLCRPFEVDRVLHRCFRSDILPDRADHPRFHDGDIFGGLYLTTRVWKDRIEPPQTDHPHESLLDMLFWDDTFPRKRQRATWYFRLVWRVSHSSCHNPEAELARALH